MCFRIRCFVLELLIVFFIFYASEVQGGLLVSNRVCYIARQTLKSSKWNTSRNTWIVASVKQIVAGKHRWQTKNAVWEVWFRDLNRKRPGLGGGRVVVIDAETFEVLEHLGGR